MPANQFRDQIALMGLSKPDAYTPYAAGDKMYGLSGRPNATSGPVSPEGMQGYKQRTQVQNARKAAVLQRMQAAQKGQYMNPHYLGGAV